MSNFTEGIRLERALARLYRGDMAAIETVYEICARSILALADSILRDHSYAEDVLQETVLKVIEGIGTYRTGGNARAWILTIARNTALDMKKARSRSVDIDDYANSGADGLFNGIADIDNKMMLSDALSTLDEAARQIVVLKVICGLKHAQIGKILGLSADAVRKRYARALKRLCAIVKDE